ncbi:MAG: NADH-quinone oxidoreductase subunit J [Actinomycetales bacterium]|nr:NADH-quinone oxidoreductase subunit J [Actinomycetales bacterium]
MQLSGMLAATDPPGTAETALFWVLAPVTVVAACGLLFARKAVHAALSMALVMIGLGVAYLVHDAPFLGAVQVFVYTGAVMMLFLFVVMLIGVSAADSLVETIKGQRLVAVVLGLGLVLLLTGAISQATLDETVGLVAVNEDPGNVTMIAFRIFDDYVWAFELTGALLITAALGAMVLTHRERLTPRTTQRQLAADRIAEGAVKAPLPAPGVFARHNAVDTPALLPDGTPSEASVNRVLRARGQVRSAEETAAPTAVIQSEFAEPLGDGTEEGGSR